jgi:hypothetical protein
MTTTTRKRSYRPTESKYKGGAKDMYVTYDLEQKTRGDSLATYPKVRRVCIAGDVKAWKSGRVTKRSGREVNGVRIAYEQSRTWHPRKAFTTHRGATTYKVAPATIGRSAHRFVQMVELPETARNVRFHTDAAALPEKYRSALQRVR